MGFTHSAKMIAKRRNIDIASLIDILSYRRPYDSEGEQEFLNVVIDTVDGMVADEFGNRYLRIPNADGSDSNVMWSCHTDTVHRSIKDGVIRQNLKWDGEGNILGLNEGKPGQCLGADDGAGVWLMLEMIKFGKPGLYLFHRGEEVGGKGSRWIEKNTPELLDGIDFAIAFDRKGCSSIITFQGGTRCCSDAFGKSLGAAISRVNGLNMTLDTGGTFTDTAVYTDLVAECTNVSVGYEWQHGPRETLDVRHMLRLRDAMLQIDTAVDLVKERKPGDRESKYQSYGGYSGYGFHSPSQNRARTDAKAWGSAVMEDDAAYEKWLTENYNNVPVGNDEDAEEATMVAALKRMVASFPETAARLLMQMGLDQWDFADTVLVEQGQKPDARFDADPESESDTEDVECKNCTGKIRSDECPLDLRCPYCYADLLDPVGEAITAQDKVLALEDKTNA